MLSRTVLPAGRRSARLAATVTLSAALLLTGSATVGAAPFDLPTGSSGIGAPAVVETPRLSSVDNFRDLAGSGGGYPAAFGLRVQPGVFYRSNALTSNDEDAAVLDSLGIAAVYDLRTDGEIADAPDRIPAGAQYIRHPLLSGNLSSTSILASLRTPEDARAVMQDINRAFVADPEIRAELGAMFTEFARTDGPQLFHCTAGKDRTGWTAAVLLSLAGVDRETVYTDYLLSNEYSGDHIRATLAALAESRGPEVAAIYAPLLTVERSYLEAGFTQLEHDFGTVHNYLITGLGLSPQTVAALSAKLVG
ncbi:MULTISPECIES: tyrosine-protein phosphatase [unclassified Rhodococcus (in: high G+C Gram-positive bacteria)]|uniref:tyrosine-protein phosphatase n=1 Tax=unclassified Rhodococcus (in: high G+C Gram-positive bacteria) TaxID=192944 RepID=UPI00200B1046|nr:MULTISPECIES: tyrosine-protein phosphatase [unclassified Rhodococcus (in: high G+C Gram-positive bacteria)]